MDARLASLGIKRGGDIYGTGLTGYLNAPYARLVDLLAERS